MKKKPAIYLSGSIEYSKTHKRWRNKMHKVLHRKFRVIIPEKVDCPFEKSDPEFQAYIHENIVMKDMINVITSRYFFVKIDKAVLKGAGTISEITTASWQDKHMVVMLDGLNPQDLPTWMLGCLAGAEFVNSIDEAIEIYKDIAKEKNQKEKEEPLKDELAKEERK